MNFSSVFAKLSFYTNVERHICSESQELMENRPYYAFYNTFAGDDHAVKQYCSYHLLNTVQQLNKCSCKNVIQLIVTGESPAVTREYFPGSLYTYDEEHHFETPKDFIWWLYMNSLEVGNQYPFIDNFIEQLGEPGMKYFDGQYIADMAQLLESITVKPLVKHKMSEMINSLNEFMKLAAKVKKNGIVTYTSGDNALFC